MHPNLQDNGTRGPELQTSDLNNTGGLLRLGTQVLPMLRFITTESDAPGFISDPVRALHRAAPQAAEQQMLVQLLDPTGAQRLFSAHRWRSQEHGAEFCSVLLTATNGAGTFDCSCGKLRALLTTPSMSRDECYQSGSIRASSARELNSSCPSRNQSRAFGFRHGNKFK
ncbi:hypothetical protein ILYODFUR_000354 [Ilyodon furcidens]|uniref:Uncharacterized protein n=1 Tax=Ilyodon furcidens TaxID=33524 RepID=A0ABV0TGQ1_9TELE